MGFRFRKSVKIAPGVKLNLAKRGASVTFGNKYARTTFGKNRTTIPVQSLELVYPILNRLQKETSAHKGLHMKLPIIHYLT